MRGRTSPPCRLGSGARRGSSGSEARITVPAPPEVMKRSPPRERMRSSMLVRPWPLASASRWKPTPLSETVMVRRCSSMVRAMAISEAWACLSTLAIASERMK